jgi:PAP2 superfamily
VAPLLPWRPVTSAEQTVVVRTRPAWLDMTLFVLAFLACMFVYELVRDVVALDEPATPAYANAAQVISAEKSLGLFIEPDVQAGVHAIPGGRFVTTWFYTIAYTAGYAGFFLWVFLRRRSHLAFLHTWYWVTNGLALLVYWLYPLAPPRFIDGLGLEDTTKAALELGGTLEWFQPFRNLYAAMPSMHVGQTVLYALSIMWLLRNRTRWVVWLWPAMMLVTVMATANHYWLDGVVGAVVVLVALTLTTLAFRRQVPWKALRSG